MIRLLMLGALVAAPLAGAAVGTERRFDVAPFAAVELASSDTVRIVPGRRISVLAAGDPAAMATLAIEVRQGTLHVGRMPGQHRDKGALVTITMPGLRAVALSGSGNMEALDAAGDSLTARLSGSGRLQLSRVRMHEVQLDLGGSGSIGASGSADRLGIDLGGSGTVDTRGLVARDLTAALHGSGDIRSAATGRAEVRAGGSGTVRVTGHPTCDVHRSGTAHVICG